MLRATILTALAATALAGCTTTTATGETAGRSATASLRTAAGADAGTVTATEMAGGIQVRIDARGMPAGLHGAHVHTTGRCDAPDFTTAGGIGTRPHGSTAPAIPPARMPATRPT